MFGLTRLSLVSLLAFTALAQDNAATSVMPSPAAGAEQSNGNAMATGSAAMPAQSDGPDGNDVPANSGGNTGWNTTYFHTPSNSKVYGFWVNGIENTALWNPVNITTRLVLTNSNKELWGGEKELQRDIPGGVGEWKGKVDEMLPTGHNYLLALYDMTSGSKLGQTSGFTVRANGTIAAPPPPGVSEAKTSEGGAQQTDAAQQTGQQNSEQTSAPAPAATETGGASSAGRVAVSGVAVVAAVAVYALA